MWQSGFQEPYRLWFQDHEDLHHASMRKVMWPVGLGRLGFPTRATEAIQNRLRHLSSFIFGNPIGSRAVHFPSVLSQRYLLRVAG
jgi:hypothetical protein